jgi:hypothetical protein
LYIFKTFYILKANYISTEVYKLPTVYIIRFASRQEREQAAQDLKAARGIFNYFQLPTEADLELGRFKHPYEGNFQGRECIIFSAISQGNIPVEIKKRLFPFPNASSPGEAVDWIRLRGWKSVELEASYASKTPAA